ncbi:hypothetical protein Ahy_A03g015175 [Arachis hypogaea]|uniref:isoflavone 7-O-methyltransferase n=1 Tax=Arachis hypogaea TaxID=3818 RepID=A0A445DZR4_ARAHY|nr:hypothetical protein Ahy_A03g015175 [Arachis hypogaea]
MKTNIYINTLLVQVAILMESNGVDHASKLLESQSHVWNHIFSFINSMSLKCAIDLGIPDAIHNHGQPMPLSKLISSLQIHPNKTQFIHRLMRILTHSGFFSKQISSKGDPESSYSLTDASKLLLKDNPMSLFPFLSAMLDPILTKPWYDLPAWFKNDSPTSFYMRHGMALWEYAGIEPRLNKFFNDAMETDTPFVSSILFDKCKGVFEGLESLVDVGGGTGTMTKALAKAFPQIECVVFDLPHVVHGLQGTGNLKYVGGDMFDSIPPSDAIFLKFILHDWNDEKCIKILKNCKEAITRSKGRKGKVIVIDMVVDDEKSDGDNKSIETQLFFDMLMMVEVNGKERNKKEWANLIFSAGFSSYKINLSALGLRSLIEIFP